MTPAEAYMIVRMEIALAEEGIGPVDQQPDDAAMIEEAGRVAWPVMNDYHRHWWKSER